MSWLPHPFHIDTSSGAALIDTCRPFHLLEIAVIDVTRENLIPVLDVKSLFPVSTPTLRRWSRSGRLETVRMGAKVFTSRGAVARMAQHGPAYGQPALPPTRRQKCNIEEHEAAKASVRKALGL